MSNRQARREQSRQARRQATSYRGGRSRGSSQGGGDGGGGGGRGTNFLSWPFLAGVSLLAAVLLALVIVLALRNSGGDGDDDVTLSIIDQALADLPTEMQNGNKLGSDDAPVKLIQYEDFQCPACLNYTLNIEPFLVEEYVKPGLMQIEFRHLPVVGQESVSAAQGAFCAAEQNRMFEYANVLFARQARGDFRPDRGAFSKEALVEFADALGLDTVAFDACLASPDSLGAVSADQDAANAIGFRGTPSFVINGAPLQSPPQSTERWREIIDAVIEAATAEDEAESDAEDDGDAGDGDESGAEAGDAEEPVPLSVIDQALADLPTEMQNGNKLGSDDAPVKMVQYEDFQCSHCLSYTLNIEPFLVEEYVKPGLLQIEFRHLPVVGQESVDAARGAYCASEQNRMFEYANRLFARQSEEGFRPDSGAFSNDGLVEYADDLGLDTDAFEACVAGADTLSAVASDQAAAYELGFRGTPSFVINGAPLQDPPQTTDGWRGVIDEAIAAAGAGDDGGS
ncbi:MAG: thioredoxin domain-containing protein [Dehalococcoidia bacterium]|nr:thioredoxin domain-containing protein [Dehalococcoidia bacterium]